MSASKLSSLLVIVAGIALTACGGSGGGSGSSSDTTPTARDYLVFIEDTSAPFSLEEPLGTGLYYRAIFSVADNDPSNIVQLNPGVITEANFPRYSISPNKQWLAFSQDYQIDGTVELFVVPLSGGTPTKMGETVIGTTVRDFQWSPNSQQLVFLADRDQAGIEEAYLVNVDGSGLMKINGSVGNPASVEIRGIVWSPNGRYILQGVFENATQKIIGYNTYDTQLGTPNSTRIVNAASGNTLRYVRWSPNNDRIVFQEDGGSVNNILAISSIYTADLSQNKNLISFEQRHSRGASFSPRADYITYYTNTNLGSSGNINTLYFYNIDTLTSDPIGQSISWFTWSPDGEKASFFIGSEMRIMDTETQTYEVVSDIDLIGQLRWSPTGQEIAHYRFNTSINIIDVESAMSNFTISETGVRTPVWAPDGSRIVYSIATNLFTNNLDGSEPVKINDDLPAVSGSTIGIESYGWSTNGERIHYTQGYDTDIDGGGINYDSYDFKLYSSPAAAKNPLLLSGNRFIYRGAYSK